MKDEEFERWVFGCRGELGSWVYRCSNVNANVSRSD
jgi:hypothetical protein